MRFIPVHTGNSFKVTGKPTWAAVHPRAYGEQRAIMRRDNQVESVASIRMRMQVGG